MAVAQAVYSEPGICIRTTTRFMYLPWEIGDWRYDYVPTRIMKRLALQITKEYYELVPPQPEYLEYDEYDQTDDCPCGLPGVDEKSTRQERRLDFWVATLRGGKNLWNRV